jgi:hypothetical protein
MNGFEGLNRVLQVEAIKLTVRRGSEATVHGQLKAVERTVLVLMQSQVWNAL